MAKHLGKFMPPKQSGAATKAKQGVKSVSKAAYDARVSKDVKPKANMPFKSTSKKRSGC